MATGEEDEIFFPGPLLAAVDFLLFARVQVAAPALADLHYQVGARSPAPIDPVSHPHRVHVKVGDLDFFLSVNAPELHSEDAFWLFFHTQCHIQGALQGFERCLVADSPVRTAYRYLQHWILHPYLWRHLEGGKLRSWGAKSLRESGRRGEPHLVGDGYARIGEGSGSTNVLTGSGVDEAWATGVYLAEAVVELAGQGKEFTRENLEATYVARRRASWVEEEAREAQEARDALIRGDTQRFAELINANFDTRASICQLQEDHVRMIQLARRTGASAKYAGSGGAIGPRRAGL